MLETPLPEYKHKLKKINDDLYIWDLIRKKYIFLTPEEWVRQNFIRFLIEEHHYPKALMKVESGLEYGKRLKRSDIVVYDRLGKAFLLVECKAASVSLTQQTLEQALMYNHRIQAKYIALSNGLYLSVYFLNPETQSLQSLETIPVFE